MKLRSGLRTPEIGGGRQRPRRFDMGDNQDKNNTKYNLDDMTAKRFKYEWPNLYISKLFSIVPKIIVGWSH